MYDTDQHLLSPVHTFLPHRSVWAYTTFGAHGVTMRSLSAGEFAVLYTTHLLIGSELWYRHTRDEYLWYIFTDLFIGSE